MGTFNLVELRAECASQLAAAEKQIKDLQAKVSEYRGKIAAIDTITGAGPNHQFEMGVVEEDEVSQAGDFTPVFAYWKPILEVLVEMGGAGNRNDVVAAVGEKMKNILKPADFGKLPKSGWTRWRNRVAWQASNMRQPEQGLIKNDSPRGIWEITDAGRKWLDDNKS